MRLLLAALALLCSSNLHAQSASTPDLPGELRIQLGSNFLIDNPDSMDTGFWGSKAFNAHYIYSVQFGNSALSFHPGLGIGTDKFSFDNNVTLGRNFDGSISIDPLDPLEFGTVNKTKLAVTYFEVPLELRFHFNKDNFKKSIKLSVGGKMGIRLSSHTKIKFEQLGQSQIIKHKDSYELNDFRYGLQGSLGYAGISVYYYYALNEMFKSGKGPEGTQTFQTQVGIAISVF
jgi:hypothetical protein